MGNINIIERYGKNAKNEIITIILNNIFRPDMLRIDKIIHNLAKKSSKAAGKSECHSILHKGNAYLLTGKTPAILLLKELSLDMDMAIEQKIQAEQVRIYLHFYLRHLLMMCQTTEDIHYLTPSNLCAYLPKSMPLKNKSLLNESHKKELKSLTSEYMDTINTYLFSRSLFLD